MKKKKTKMARDFVVFFLFLFVFYSDGSSKLL